MLFIQGFNDSMKIVLVLRRPRFAHFDFSKYQLWLLGQVIQLLGVWVYFTENNLYVAGS